jgi:hypothetical protein
VLQPGSACVRFVTEALWGASPALPLLFIPAYGPLPPGPWVIDVEAGNNEALRGAIERKNHSRVVLGAR